MGFKLKKKSGNRSVNEKSNVNFVAKIQSQIEQYASLFGESKKSKPILYVASVCLVVASTSLAYLFYSVPRHNELTRSMGELRLLSQTISRQATEATASGSPEAMKELIASRQLFAKNIKNVENIYGTSSKEYKKVAGLWKSLAYDIDLISSQQNVINQLYNMNISISDSIPEIQAEYNLMVDKMVREKVSSNQVVVAKNQVFIAERILRSINSVFVGTENSENSAHDFSVDIETFGVYLDAQLNGNTELGVAKVDSPEVRESLEGIKTEYDKVLKSAATSVLKHTNQIVNVRQSSSEIFSQSDAMLNALGDLSDQTQYGWQVFALVALLTLSLLGLIGSVLKLFITS